MRGATILASINARVLFKCKRARGILHGTNTLSYPPIEPSFKEFLHTRKFQGVRTGNRTRAVKLRSKDESTEYLCIVKGILQCLKSIITIDDNTFRLRHSRAFCHVLHGENLNCND